MCECMAAGGCLAETLRARIAKLERTYEAHAAHARAAQSRYEKSLDRIAELEAEITSLERHD